MTDYVHSDPEALMQESGLVAKWLVTGLDKAANLQYKTIMKYVDRLKEKNPQATPAEIQAKLDKHFLLTITGTGAGAGVTAAIPVVGFVTGAVAVGVESLAFLDAATFYAVASAYLRGVDITVGGNLCTASGAGDLPVVLLAFDALVDAPHGAGGCGICGESLPAGLQLRAAMSAVS